MTTSEFRQRRRDPSGDRDTELESLRQERDEAVARERVARKEADTAQRRLSELSAASRRFASTMRGLSGERQRSRRRLSAQYAVSRVLAECGSLEEAAPKLLEIVGEGLGWNLGALWVVDESADVLRCAEVWRAPGTAPGPFEETARRTGFPRGRGLPGRAWSTGTAVCADDLAGDARFLRTEMAAEGLRRAIAFPIRDGGWPLGVIELLDRETEPIDDDLIRTVNLIGHQIGQFVERRRAEREREKLLVREREARAESERAHDRTTSILESVGDAFISVDRERRLVYVNGEAERLWGKKREELLGRRLAEVFPEAVDSEIFRTVARANAEGVIGRFESLSRVSGRWISGTAYPSEDGVSVYFRDVTESKRAENALRASEERYRTLAANVPGAVFRADVEDGRPIMRFVSDRIEEITGHPAGDFVADRVRNYGEVVHPEDRPRNDREVWRALEEREPYDVEYCVLHADGTVRWANERGSGVFSDDGTLLSVDGLILDVTERKRAEEAMRENEEQLQLALDASEMGTFTWYPEEDRAELDARMLELFGLPEDSVLNLATALETMIHSDDGARYAGAVARATDPRGSGELREDIRVIHPDGTERWLAVTGRVDFEGERPKRMVGNAVDITERKRAEEALRESEERFRSLIRHASDIITVLSADGTILYESPSVERILGYDPEEMVGEIVTGYVHPEDVERVRAVGAGLVERGGITGPLEVRFRHADGSWKHLEAISTNLLDEPSVGGIVINSRDITERKRVEEERERLRVREREARDEAEAALERLSFLAGASEERRRISRELHDRVAHSMGVVHQSLELYRVLKDRDKGAAETKMDLARELAKSALDSTRNLSTALRESEIGKGLGPALSMLLGTTIPAEIRYAVSVEGDEDLIPPRAGEQLFLILREAVRNAVTHSGADQITVELDISPTVAVGRVEDNGRGFDPEAVLDGRCNGLRSMRERALLLGGSFDLKPGIKDRGTRIEVVVPLAPQEGEL